jgi:SAM-dependent methyltransferase
MTQFHFDPATYAELMREEAPAYGRLQQEVGLATAGFAVSSVLDLVISALALHHLDRPEKADLFARIAGVLHPGGRFVLGDVVIRLDQADAVIPVTDGHDRPSTLADQLHWLSDAGFDAATTWSEHDLVVVRAEVVG